MEARITKLQDDEKVKVEKLKMDLENQENKMEVTEKENSILKMRQKFLK